MPSMDTGIIHSNAHISKQELLKKIGGDAVLHAAVDEFYARLLSDKELMPFFEHANVTVLKWHQFNIMSIAFTQVPDNFDIKKLILTKHANMFDSGLTAHHYDIVCRHFEETLQDLNIDPDVIAQAKAVVTPLRDIFEQGKQDANQRSKCRKRQHDMVLVAMVGAVAYGVFRLLQSKRHH